MGVAKEEASWGCGNILGNSLLEGPRRGSLKELLNDGESPGRSLILREDSWDQGQGQAFTQGSGRDSPGILSRLGPSCQLWFSALIFSLDFLMTISRKVKIVHVFFTTEHVVIYW